ncbi:MAG TPA: N-6 DNA methylase [Gemmatimonadales bacterium]|nr:N-6 DNA methylase [Gemmatimonadales bacterium]
MDPVALLSGLRTLPDLRQLVALLGHQPLWQEFPPETFAVPAALVGRAGPLEWLAIASGRPAEEARRLSARLAGRGRLVAVLALDERRRSLALAVTLDRPVVTAFDLDRPAPEARERLRRLAQVRADGVLFLVRAAEAITSESAGHRFFRAFAALADRMAAGLTGEVRPRDRRDLALIQLTRVLFLYFVQCRGWLDGRPDFLRAAVDRCLARGRRLHRDLFRPLFFGTLNRPSAARGRARAFGRIPFLNGGLFEPHPLERAWRGEVPDEVWRDAFDSVFERFHFAVVETAAPGIIAPDMLGRVFEGLMAPEARRASGAYYTPAPLVRRLVDAGLEAFLASRLGWSDPEARARLAAPDHALRQVLAGLAILDPAAGSGAFLLGALERLAELRAGELPPAALRRAILARNLFGVDLNPMAIRLAELRLWLAVLAVEPAAEPEAVDPLPNLDGLLRQGDSLLEPGRLLGRLGLRTPAEAAPLTALRAELVQAVGAAKREAARALRRAEARVYGAALAEAERRFERRIVECLTAARGPTLFGARRGLDRELRARIRAARRGRSEVRRLARRLRREGEAPWFSYECQFGDILARGGFDLVVGNPPWVRAEELAAGQRAALRERYRWWRTSGPGFRHQPDLALAFLERGVELLAPGGALAMLLPAKVATAGYARLAREHLARTATLYALADLGATGHAFDATVYPAAIVLGKRRPRADHRVRATLESGAGTGTPQCRFGSGPWILSPEPLLDALEALRAGHPRLGDRLTPQLGVKTGANAVFLDPPPCVEAALIRWAVRGRDVRPFRCERRRRLLWPHDQAGRVYPRIPAGAAAWLRQHEAILRVRADYVRGPWWTLFRTEGAVAPHRVIWADLARRLMAVALTGPDAAQLLPLNTCYVAALDRAEAALALAAWLNSTWLRAAARAGADPAASGYARFNARVVAELPLPDNVLSDPGLAALARRGAAAPVQEEVDEHCARLLGLTPAARAALAAVPGVRHAPDRR